ncbi:MAG: M20/M25/M40 family metallo-hydrolase [Planctomycetota bacterium]|nr:M20/M25/M40 family metallo-hydrolase [Planctomycetota bacterium]
MTDAKDTVSAWLDAHCGELYDFARDLVRVPSVTPWFGGEPEFMREGDVQSKLAAKLSALGGEIDLWEPDAEALAGYEGKPGYYAGRDFTGRPNLAAVFPGSGGGRSLLLLGHADVVPAATGWTREPFAGEIDDGWLYGRGSVDMKGGIAAMIFALEAILASGLDPKGKIIVGSVVDEEAGGMGTLAFVDRGYLADAGLMTEPTGLKVGNHCHGILWGKLHIPGRGGHIELPRAHWRRGGAVDAIDKARLFLDFFERWNADWRFWRWHPYAPKPCEIHAAQVASGEFPTSYAGSATITFNVQYLPGERDGNNSGGAVKVWLEEEFRRVAETDPWLREGPPTVEWMVDADCAEVSPEHPFVACLSRSLETLGLPGEIEGNTSHTDIGWFVNSGVAMLNFGPGETRLAHQADERVSLTDLLKSAKAIAGLIVEWCGVA